MNEYPQTVAVVLTKVKPDHAARVLSILPDGFAMEVVMRMLRMETVQKEVLDGVERTLRAEFMSNLARSARRDSHELMAEIFNNLDRAAAAMNGRGHVVVEELALLEPFAGSSNGGRRARRFTISNAAGRSTLRPHEIPNAFFFPSAAPMLD